MRSSQIVMLRVAGRTSIQRALTRQRSMSAAYSVRMQSQNKEEGRRGSKARMSTRTESTTTKKDEALLKTGSDEWHWAPYVVVALLGSIGAWFWRASRSQSNRDAVLKSAAERQTLARAEREELRKANPRLSAAVLTDVGIGCIRHFGPLSTKVAYPDFIRLASAFLEAPIEAGHLIDRVVVTCAKRDASEELDLGFLIAVLALAFPGDLDDKAKALANILANITSSSQAETVNKTEAVRLIHWLDQAGHLPPSSLVTDTPPKYPVQQYTLKTPQRLVDDAILELTGITSEDYGDQLDSLFVALIVASPTLNLL